MTASSGTAQPADAGEWGQAEPSYAHIPGMDPYVEWALGAGRPHFFMPGRQRRWIPILVRLNGISPDDFADGQQFVDDGQSLALWRASVRLSPIYRGRGVHEPYCTAMVTPGFFEFMKRSDKLRQSVTRVTIGLPLDAESLPAPENSKDAGNGQP